MTQAKTYTMPGYSRYYFTADGKAFNQATTNPLAVDQMKYGEKKKYYRLIEDGTQKRNCIYVDAIIAHCKEQDKPLHPGCSNDITCLNSISRDCSTLIAPIEKTHARKNNPELVTQIRQDFASGMKQAKLVAKYDLNKSTISRIVSGKYHAEKATTGQDSNI